ncbi:hypothetical protein HELRODRAFT_166878 [Helobdella robusta]|uniref:Uncharacterized protein n=1 Tax=Helobdella robusta TaxID=6412 RepID=T1EYP4_HELRO|nr:hypothetical protein HELRODRAFT_166878 [Helobdella robusta]ESO11824.1 hypothetical protein HELRODRAFT_166878 [Helobdella robusta]
MTEKTVLIANELLCYLFSNVKFLDNPNFVAAAFEFFTAEEINVAKNQLLADMESLKQNKLGGGIGIFVRKEFDCFIDDNIESVDDIFEAFSINIKSNSSNKLPLKIISIYRPPNTSIEKFINEFENILHKLSSAQEKETLTKARPMCRHSEHRRHSLLYKECSIKHKEQQKTHTGLHDRRDETGRKEQHKIHTSLLERRDETAMIFKGNLLDTLPFSILIL